MMKARLGRWQYVLPQPWRVLVSRARPSKKHAQVIGLLLLVLLPALLTLCGSEGPALPAGDATIARLVHQLGSDKFSEREAAGEALAAIGQPALDALQQAAATSDDAEIRRRATNLVQAIRNRLLSGRQPKLRATLTGKPAENVWSVAFSPDGKTLASAGSKNTIALWDVALGKEKAHFQAHDPIVSCVAFSPDGKTLASGGWDRTVTLWDMPSGKNSATFQHSEGVACIAFSPDGKSLAVGNGCRIQLRDVPSGKVKRDWFVPGAEHFGDLLSLAFSPDGKTVAGGGTENTITLCDVATRLPKTTLAAHTDWVTSVAFSPDGKTLACAGREGIGRVNDSALSLWDLATGKENESLQPYLPPATFVAFSPDGSTLASTGFGSPITLWDLATGQRKAIFQGQAGSASVLAFSPDGKILVSNSADKTIRNDILDKPKSPAYT